MGSFQVRYSFLLPNGERPNFTLGIDEETLELSDPEPDALPDWTRLSFHQCSNCPLREETHPRCPVAVRFVDIAERFEQVVSYDSVRVEVETEDRKIEAETRAERALASLMGLIMATSGCPHTAFFKPMARFHLPLATRLETIFRSVATYLLAQYMRGVPAAAEADLSELYARMRIVNASITRRLRAAGRTDSTLNAVVLLDVYAMAVPTALEDTLEEIRHLLGPSLAVLEESQ